MYPLFIVAACSLALPALAAQGGYEACTSLTAALGLTIVQSAGLQYSAAASGAWNLFNDGYRPRCIVFPTSASHVQTAMGAIYAAGSRYAVQAGSHTAMVGWNSVDDAVLILFSQMKGVSYNATSDTITVDPGVHWGDAVAQLEPLGVAPVGGRQSDVGTGFLLGGGSSFLSPAHGYGADNIKEADVVLVNGTMVTANADNAYEDLFRALKGGANRFGIYPNSSLPALLNATAHYVSNVADPKAVLLVSIVVVVTTGIAAPPLAIVNLFYNGTSLPPSTFSEFLSIPSINSTLSPLSYYDITNVLPAGGQRGSGQHYGASTFTGDPALFSDAFTHFENFTSAFAGELSLSTMAFTPVLQPQIDAGRARGGGNALDPPDGGYAHVQLAQQFAPGVTRMPGSVRRGVDLLLSQVPASPGKPLFMNECDQNQNVFASYGGYAALRETYRKYDPTRFNVEHLDGPLGL
ncbi:hypothetical protein PLICRDRAFT_57276 [Plicaturopsis crispa FD-325 SS-3]|uniref:FAD-binding PCMH-type domain-containing protein n=1 Tax=Plicaturopsis crispa FD-325 SS-3 TaxID=944288 RepID=A0A0C9T958_PLICR|nr:hypothetical protein PLICRDRAFT_57276 [Plicaturopsis crispa FD-325 SS-3]